MQYTTLGHTGLVVSRLAFGAMTFGTGELVILRTTQPRLGGEGMVLCKGYSISYLT